MIDLILDWRCFGVDIVAINETPTVPERIFCCWIEDWEKPLIISNMAASKLRFFQEYKGLFFTVIYTNETFTISRLKCTGSHSEVVGGM